MEGEEDVLRFVSVFEQRIFDQEGIRLHPLRGEFVKVDLVRRI